MSEQKETPVAVHSGKLWKNDSLYDTFELADAYRKKLLDIWNENDAHKGMQVKVKRLPSKNQFVVKTRLHPDFEPVKKEKKKKNVKRSKKNKRNNVDGKFDPQRSD